MVTDTSHGYIHESPRIILLMVLTLLITFLMGLLISTPVTADFSSRRELRRAERKVEHRQRRVEQLEQRLSEGTRNPGRVERQLRDAREDLARAQLLFASQAGSHTPPPFGDPNYGPTNVTVSTIEVSPFIGRGSGGPAAGYSVTTNGKGELAVSGNAGGIAGQVNLDANTLQPTSACGGPGTTFGVPGGVSGSAAIVGCTDRTIRGTVEGEIGGNVYGIEARGGTEEVEICVPLGAGSRTISDAERECADRQRAEASTAKQFMDYIRGMRSGSARMNDGGQFLRNCSRARRRLR